MNFLKKIAGGRCRSRHDAYRVGMHHYNRSRYGDAIRCFEQVVSGRVRSDSLRKKLAGFYCGRSYTNLGAACFAKNETREALDHFQKALAFIPDDSDLNRFIGICRCSMDTGVREPVRPPCRYKTHPPF